MKVGLSRENPWLLATGFALAVGCRKPVAVQSHASASASVTPFAKSAQEGAQLSAAKKLRDSELADALPKCTDKRFSDGCAALGERYANGTIGEVNLDVAFQLFTRGCDGGSTYGCNSAGWASLHGRGTPANLAVAAGFFARACSTGNEHPFGCDSRGFALVTGLAGTPRDLALGQRLLSKTCARGLAQSCLLLEMMAAKALSARTKHPLACEVSISEQVGRCSNDQDPEACFLAGSAFETGVCGAPRSAARSAQYLARAAKFGASWPSKR